MTRAEREKTETNAKKNLKAKRFRNEVSDMLFSHEFLSRADANDVLIFQKSNIMIKDESNESIEQRLRQSILEGRGRGGRGRQIGSGVGKKRKAKEQYSQKPKAVRDRARMVKYSNEEKVIARVKNADRAAWHYALNKLKEIEKYKQMTRAEREKAETNAKKNLKAKKFRDEVSDMLFSHEFLSRTN